MEDEKSKVRGTYLSKVRNLSGSTIEALHKMVSEILKQKELNRDGIVQFPNTSENQVILAYLEDKIGIRPFISNRPWFKVDKCQLDFYEEDLKSLATLDEILIQKLEKRNTTIKGLCRFENNAFFITLKNGTEKPITFETRRDTKYMLALFKILYEHWQRLGNEPLEKGEIRRRMGKEGVTGEISDKFIKNTVSNIRKKIDSAVLSDCIVLKYDRASDGFSLDIKIPS